MDFEILIPISVFVAIVMSIKIVCDYLLRRRLTTSNGSQELITAMLQTDEQGRRLSALKWGLVLTLVGISFGLISAMHLDSNNPGTWGLLIGAAGVGMLAYHALAGRSRGN